jgi:hypothetical protein
LARATSTLRRAELFASEVAIWIVSALQRMQRRVAIVAFLPPMSLTW